MTTTQQLEAQGELVKIEVELDYDEEPQRLIYALPHVIYWMDNVLPGLETDGYISGANRPAEQLEALLYDMISGKTVFEMPPHCMEPEGDGMWELRTHDLRLFGFFWRKGTFIITAADTKARCLQHGLYEGYRNEGQRHRDRLDLDPPKFVPGRDPNHVL